MYDERYQKQIRLRLTREHVDLIFAKDAGVFDQTYELPEGTIFGMIGPSGCGKTTTVRLMIGLLAPERGNLTCAGPGADSLSRRRRERIGYMPQQFVLYPNLTWENLNFVASLYGMGYCRRRKQRWSKVLEFVELSDARDRLGSQLSGGMQRRLELACTLVHDPLLMFADEPTAGIDPVLRGKFWDHFRQLRDQGRTLFVTTQYVGEASLLRLGGGDARGPRCWLVDTPEGLRRRRARRRNHPASSWPTRPAWTRRLRSCGATSRSRMPSAPPTPTSCTSRSTTPASGCPRC